VGPGLNPNFSGPSTPYLLVSGWADPNTYNPDGSIKTLNFGNASRTDPVIRGFGYFNEDLNLFKDTRLTERFGLRFEAQAGNLLNRVDFCNPNTSWSSGAFDPSTNAGGFGNVSSQCNLPRTIPFGLTLQF